MHLAAQEGFVQIVHEFLVAGYGNPLDLSISLVHAYRTLAEDSTLANEEADPSPETCKRVLWTVQNPYPKRSHTSTVTMLLLWGADPSICDDAGTSVFQYTRAVLGVKVSTDQLFL